MLPINLNIEETVSKLGVLDKILESYSRHLAYKTQIKQLDVELERINSQARLAHNQIEKQYQLKIKELEFQRDKFISTLQMISRQLDNHHVQKMMYLEIANKCIASAGNCKNSDERMFLLEMAKEAKNDALNLSKDNTISLDLLIHKLPSPNQYLIGGK